MTHPSDTPEHHPQGNAFDSLVRRNRVTVDALGRWVYVATGQPVGSGSSCASPSTTLSPAVELKLPTWAAGHRLPSN